MVKKSCVTVASGKMNGIWSINMIGKKYFIITMSEHPIVVENNIPDDEVRRIAEDMWEHQMTEDDRKVWDNTGSMFHLRDGKRLQLDSKYVSARNSKS